MDYEEPRYDETYEVLDILVHILVTGRHNTYTSVLCSAVERL